MPRVFIYEQECNNQASTICVRGAPLPGDTLGPLQFIHSGFVNIGSQETEGIDFAVQYSFDLSNSTLTLGLDYTHLLKFDKTVLGADGLTFETQEFAGEYEYPEDRAALTGDYRFGDWGATARVNYISSFKDFRNLSPGYDDPPDGIVDVRSVAVSFTTVNFQSPYEGIKNTRIQLSSTTPSTRRCRSRSATATRTCTATCRASTIRAGGSGACGRRTRSRSSLDGWRKWKGRASAPSAFCAPPRMRQWRMTAKIIDGKRIAEEFRREVRKGTDALRAGGRAARASRSSWSATTPPRRSTCATSAGACEETGIASVAHDLPASTTEAELLALIDRLNADPAIDGILVQLPLPAHIGSTAVLERIDPAKDVDGFHPYNVGRLAQGTPVMRPCTPYGMILMLEREGLEARGKNAVIVGRSNIVGRPMALELLMKAATVTICHSQTKDLAGHVGEADILVAAIGKPEFVPGAWIRPGAIVLDVGINRLPDGRLVGDVEFDAARERAGWITPVPGGVGPMTIAALMKNTLESATRGRRGADRLLAPPGRAGRAVLEQHALGRQLVADAVGLREVAGFRAAIRACTSRSISAVNRLAFRGVPPVSSERVASQLPAPDRVARGRRRVAQLGREPAAAFALSPADFATLSSRASACRAAIASGVLKSSSIAAAKRPSTRSPFAYSRSGHDVAQRQCTGAAARPPPGELVGRVVHRPAVVARQQEERAAPRAGSSRQHFARGEEVAERLRHLLVVDVEEAVVHPDLGERRVAGAPQVCAISFSWCGNLRSRPPPWMSKCSPSSCVDMAEHSMCQPGRPSPHGRRPGGLAGLGAISTARNRADRAWPSSTSTREPARRSSSFLPDSLPYAANLCTSYITSPFDRRVGVAVADELARSCATISSM